ncbi:3-methyladenine DNA glycosylase/8-oxoguanine DNA glycosylase [Agromyces terreus]|uniref:3-methyladenine DNA glycosylase/8-oxoguanine DNA glycosylase n=1 Tax=Agromyces terreus TaxID=424795 RepID=A0A9X2H0G0_9MICO|nr:DNA-3-methyladenine glycosylase 2 family protein [Agromyces terreus]MCP2370278.1 3-methyladenine DNA glycosylase/8-oxoguanine DNA glycosylase [Agromyces terreus]
MTAEHSRTWRPRHPTDLWQTVGTLRRGPGDPTFRRGADGAAWRATRTASGIATVRYAQVARDELRVDAWGPGAAECVDEAPGVLGEADDPGGFEPRIALIAEAHRRNPGLRMLRTARVVEALVPAILEQKVITLQAHDSWRSLVHRFGEEAPGPGVPVDGGARRPLKVAPSPDQWARVPSWEWHRAGVDPRRSRTIVTAVRRAPRLEEASAMTPADAAARLRALDGVGEWTAAEVAQRAFGDADALAVGDYHLSNYVGHALWGRDMTDDEMVEAMAPWQGHRHRVVRLLGLAGVAGKPKRGPRMPFVDHRAI